MRSLILALAAIAVAALVGVRRDVGGLGGGRLRRRQADARRVLDPARGLRAADEGLRQDGRRQGRQLRRVLRQLGRAEPCRRVGAPGRGRRLLARARCHPARRGRPGRGDLGAGQVQGHGHELGRRLRGAEGQPQGDQDLGRPREGRRGGDRAEPVHIGWRPLERHGRVRRAAEAGQDPRAGGRVPPRALQARVRPGQERARVAADVHGGKGDVLLAYENEAILAQRRARTSTTSSRTRRS